MKYATWDVQALCPFYRRSDKAKHNITCEGITSSSRISLVFLGKEKEREQHMIHYCCRDYQKCPLYGAVYQQYE